MPDCSRPSSFFSEHCDPCDLRIAGRHDEAGELEFEVEQRQEHDRRYRAVRMALAGEFSALARQLALWGIKPNE